MDERTVGVDFAVAPERTVACVIEWASQQAIVQAPLRPVDDGRLKELIRDYERIGLDVPLGWPEAFVNALAAHRRVAPWPIARGQEESFFFRATDRFLREHTGVVPLAVTADRIARTAARAARLLSDLAAEGCAIDRSGMTGRVVEVYPAAALRRWASRVYRYKGLDGKIERATLAEELFGRDWLTFAPGCREIYATDEDSIDALVCSLVTRAHSKGLCEPIPAQDLDCARIEGWIALPREGTLDELPG